MSPASLAHPDVASWRAAGPDDIDQIHELVAAQDRVDHPSWTTTREDIADQFADSMFDPAIDSIAGFAADGSLIAFGAATLHSARDEQLKVMMFGGVHPEHRRRGIGTVVLDWQVARARAIVTAQRQGLPTEFELYAEDGQRDKVAIAERAGFAIERWFTTMERDMTAPVAGRSVPDGIALTSYTPEHSEASRLAKNDAFRDHWGSLPISVERWGMFVGGTHFRADLSTVATEGERVVAFSLVTVNEDDWESLGASHAYIALIGVVRDWRGRGLAPAVIAGTLQRVADAGLERTLLDVDTASPTGANTLYERLGFAATDRTVALVLRG